jgi:uncharacterized protein
MHPREELTLSIPAILGVLELLSQHWALLAIGLTCLSLLGFVAWILVKYVRIGLNVFMDTHPPYGLGVPDFDILYGEIVRFRSFDGTSLRGMHLNTPNRNAVKGMIVFCHEFSADMFSCARYIRPLIEAGFDVFTFDFRGHGDSSLPGRYKPLQWPSDKEMNDVLGACGYVTSVLKEQGRCTDIGVVGISRGAGAALLAASTNPQIKAIVCDGAFSTHATLVTLMKRWASIFASVRLVYENHPDAVWYFLLWLIMRFAQPRLACRFLSVRWALKHMQPRPMLFIHGKMDSYIQVEQTQLLYAIAPDPKYLWLVDKAKHNQSALVQPRQYAQRTINFFRKYLAGEAVTEAEITHPADAEVA